jgi:hypothetical protein
MDLVDRQWTWMRILVCRVFLMIVISEAAMGLTRFVRMAIPSQPAIIVAAIRKAILIFIWNFKEQKP